MFTDLLMLIELRDELILTYWCCYEYSLIDLLCCSTFPSAWMAFPLIVISWLFPFKLNGVKEDYREIILLSWFKVKVLAFYESSSLIESWFLQSIIILPLLLLLLLILLLLLLIWLYVLVPKDKLPLLISFSFWFLSNLSSSSFN